MKWKKLRGLVGLVKDLTSRMPSRWFVDRKFTLSPTWSKVYLILCIIDPKNLARQSTSSLVFFPDHQDIVKVSVPQERFMESSVFPSLTVQGTKNNIVKMMGTACAHGNLFDLLIVFTIEVDSTSFITWWRSPLRKFFSLCCVDYNREVGCVNWRTRSIPAPW